MTVTADSQKRVRLQSINPGDRFEVQESVTGTFVLTKLASTQNSPAKVSIKKRDGFTVGVIDQPIDEDALNEALKNFP